MNLSDNKTLLFRPGHSMKPFPRTGLEKMGWHSSITVSYILSIPTVRWESEKKHLPHLCSTLNFDLLKI